jgi:hypothetical protein
MMRIKKTGSCSHRIGENKKSSPFEIKKAISEKK